MVVKYILAYFLSLVNRFNNLAGGRLNTTTNIDCNYDNTGYFNGRHCRVTEGYDITLDFGEMDTRQMIESQDFQILFKAFGDVHRFWDDAYLRRGRE